MDKGSEIEFVSVSKFYGVQLAVDNINLKVPSNTYCCLLGPSGFGKTTSLRMIAGHETVTEGEICFGYKVINGLPPSKRGTAMMFQDYALFPHLSCLDNVAFSLKYVMGTKILTIMSAINTPACSKGRQSRFPFSKGLIYLHVSYP